MNGTRTGRASSLFQTREPVPRRGRHFTLAMKWTLMSTHLAAVIPESVWLRELSGWGKKIQQSMCEGSDARKYILFP